MSGKWIKRSDRPHSCDTPSERKEDIVKGDIWECDCSQRWIYVVNYAGVGWERTP